MTPPTLKLIRIEFKVNKRLSRASRIEYNANGFFHALVVFSIMYIKFFQAKLSL